jgi:ATP synthase in type III secretion protein N
MSTHHFNYITDMLQTALAQAHVVRVRGRVVQVTGTIIRAVVPSVKIGEICELHNPGDDRSMKAEVVGFSQGSALLMPMGDMQGISGETEVIPSGPCSHGAGWECSARSSAGWYG